MIMSDIKATGLYRPYDIRTLIYAQGAGEQSSFIHLFIIVLISSF